MVHCCDNCSPVTEPFCGQSITNILYVCIVPIQPPILDQFSTWYHVSMYLSLVVILFNCTTRYWTGPGCCCEGIQVCNCNAREDEWREGSCSEGSWGRDKENTHLSFLQFTR